MTVEGYSFVLEFNPGDRSASGNHLPIYATGAGDRFVLKFDSAERSPSKVHNVTLGADGWLPKLNLESQNCLFR